MQIRFQDRVQDRVQSRTATPSRGLAERAPPPPPGMPAQIWTTITREIVERSRQRAANNPAAVAMQNELNAFMPASMPAATTTSSTTSSTEPPAVASSEILGRGMCGPAVESLQYDLVKLGFMTQAVMNSGPGIFGPRTEAGIKAIQRAAGLSETGICDADTRAAIAAALQGSQTPAAPTSSQPDLLPAPGSVGVAPSVIGAASGDGTVAGALTWAQDQMAGGTQAGVNRNNNESTADNVNAWNSWCLAFVATAYGRKEPLLAAGSAIDAFTQFETAGRISLSRDIPAGMPVFFAATGSNGGFGHIVLATGRTDENGDPIMVSSGWDGRPGIFEIPLSQLEALTGAYIGYGQL